MTPTQRTLAELKKRGWTAQVVERWNPYARVRVDLFGCIDIVAIDNGERWAGAGRALIGIQCCAGSSHAARRNKITEEPRMREWLATDARLEIWSWSKQGARGKQKRWTLRVEEITSAMWEGKVAA